jgi:site-specific recombinase XerD
VSQPARQLFAMHEKVDLPTTVLRTYNSTRIHCQRVHRFPFVRWPSGYPCEPVNGYLLDSASCITGDTLKTYAAELSPLIRYCAAHNVSFEQLDEAHFCAFAEALQNERLVNRPAERIRSNNTVRRILSRAIAFLQWYGGHLMLVTQTPLIGEVASAPRIVVRRHHNRRGSRQGRDYLVHRAMPTPNSREPKHPLPQSIIEDVEQMIETLSDLEAQKELATQRPARRPDCFVAQREYVRARRRFMVWIMKRTGLRPAEMIELPVSENASILRTQRLIIPTKKRRSHVAPMRRVPVTLKDAATFQCYLVAREKYIRQIREIDPTYRPPDALFLGVTGEQVKKTSLEKDFERLVKACGHHDVRACLSMFRHRFITLEVIVHLKEFMGSAGKGRHLMTDGDYRSILKRITAKTGHLAWAELDVWANVDRQLERVRAGDRLHEELLDLRRSLPANSSSLGTEFLEKTAARLSEILNDAKQCLPGGA